MKKAITLSFLLLANIIILVHTFVPHHRHNQISFTLDASSGKLCDDATYEYCCDDDIMITQQEGNSHHHHHTLKECVLESATTFTRINDNKRTFQLFNFNLLSVLFSLPSEHSLFRITDNVGAPFRQKPYLQFYYIEYLSLSLGLRAPPIC